MPVSGPNRRPYPPHSRGLPALRTQLTVTLVSQTLQLLASTATVDIPFFENHIRPQLAEHCFPCHSATATKIKGGLQLDSRELLIKGGDSGPAIIPGNPIDSRLLQALRHQTPDLAMPRGPNGPVHLPEPVIQNFAKWIEAGAPFPSTAATTHNTPRTPTNHWSFQPVQNPPAPPVLNTRWPKTSIDRFLLNTWEKHSIRPAPAADRRTLIRRVTLDLTGLPPSAADVDAFLADHSPQAYERLVERLLASPHYGEQWGRHWLDVVRYADTAGETADYPIPTAWRYRNYVIDAFNADKPYDEFIREQIAGDILAHQNPTDRYAERIIATGFLAISRRFGFDSENYHHLTLQDTIDTLGQSVLGLTLGCARCHAHKFDPISMTDYYALYGIFESTRYPFPGSEQKQKFRALAPLLPPAQTEPKWLAFETRLATLSRTLEQIKKAPPTAILRSLDDLDGDFELQAPAAGGSNGVLVPPWIYHGLIAITTDAQSPFKNLHPFGKVGASIPASHNPYRIHQALHLPKPPPTELHLNLDFKVGTPQTNPTTHHRFWIGSDSTHPSLECLIGPDSITLRQGTNLHPIGHTQPNEWLNLQLTLNLVTHSAQATLTRSTHLNNPTTTALPLFTLFAPDAVGFDATPSPTNPSPALAIDNLAVQTTPIPPATLSPPDPVSIKDPAEPDALRREWETLLAHGPVELAYAMSEGTPHDAALQQRGDPEKPGRIVPRGFLECLGGNPLPPDAHGSGRLELANWLTQASNPLTARVMVNRIWQHHFGHGLVPTPNDFGTRGLPPTHPKLLDHLTTRFIQSGWSIKSLHRLILTSAAYQQASTPTTGQPTAPDPLTPFPRRRLTAEELRDAILLVTTTLDPTPAFEHPFPAPTTWGYTQHGPFTATYDHAHRSVYLMTQRNKRHPYLALFDGADPNASTAERRTTTVPTQALYFLNDPFVHSSASHLASTLSTHTPNENARIDALYHHILSRPPSRSERNDAHQFLIRYQTELQATQPANTSTTTESLAALARVLFASNEFLTVD